MLLPSVLTPISRSPSFEVIRSSRYYSSTRFRHFYSRLTYVLYGPFTFEILILLLIYTLHFLCSRFLSRTKTELTEPTYSFRTSVLSLCTLSILPLPLRHILIPCTTQTLRTSNRSTFLILNSFCDHLVVDFLTNINI